MLLKPVVLIRDDFRITSSQALAARISLGRAAEGVRHALPPSWMFLDETGSGSAQSRMPVDEAPCRGHLYLDLK